MVHFLQDPDIATRILGIVSKVAEPDSEAISKVDISKVVDLDRTSFVRAKQCLTRKINRLIKQHNEYYFELGKSSSAVFYGLEDMVKLYVLAASRDADKIGQLFDYYVDKYIPRLKNLNKFRQVKDLKPDSEGYFYLYLVFLRNRGNMA